MKNERFERYIYTGVTAILVLIAAVFVVFLFLERSAVFAFLGKVRFVLAPVIYGAVLAFLMSPVYNWCYRLTVWRIGAYYKYATWSGLYTNKDVSIPFIWDVDCGDSSRTQHHRYGRVLPFP